MDADVMVLRRFRDDHMKKSVFGSSLISFYYRNSPPIAEIIGGNEALRTMTRLAIVPIVYIMKHQGLGLLALGIFMLPAIGRRQD
jgi:hypothetical protein